MSGLIPLPKTHDPIHELSKLQIKVFLNGYPEITAFTKELLIPGSTK